MLVRLVLGVTLLVVLSGAPSAAALQMENRTVLAQASPTPGQPNVTGDLPSATWALIVIAVGLAAYISYRLGREQENVSKRREGPISRALSGSGPRRDKT